MKKAIPGCTVMVHYIGTLDNGAVFDSRDDKDPLTFRLGDGTIFPALEQQIIGMGRGQTRNIFIAAADAYGPRNNENLLRVDRDKLPAVPAPEPGKLLTITFIDGEQRIMRIIGCDETAVTLDANHPLAGLDLTFALTLVRIDP